jgi:achilleol B synthase
VEPTLNIWPVSKLRERALSSLMEYIHFNDETTKYIGICPIDKVNVVEVVHIPLFYLP